MPEANVHAIRHIEFTGNAQAKEIALVITGADGETRAYAINPVTLRALLTPIISLAATWSGDPELKPQDLVGGQNALMAQKILFNRGRDSSEGAIRIFLGKDLDMTFLMPLDQLVPSFQAFAQKLTITMPQRPPDQKPN
jgi:hypothetical protein